MTKLMGNGKDTQEDEEEEEEEVEEQYDEQFDSDHEEEEEEEDHHPESTLQPASHLSRLAKPQPTAA